MTRRGSKRDLALADGAGGTTLTAWPPAPGQEALAEARATLADARDFDADFVIDACDIILAHETDTRLRRDAQEMKQIMAAMP